MGVLRLNTPAKSRNGLANITILNKNNDFLTHLSLNLAVKPIRKLLHSTL